MNLEMFGHHPDPCTDFCVEVEALEGLTYDFNVGIENNKISIQKRIDSAMGFRVGGSISSINAKHLLRKLTLRAV